MAAYSIVADVQSEFKDITFGANGKVTSTEVTEFITQADEEINSYINNRYAIPVSSSISPLASKLVKQLSIWLVTDRISKILKVKSETEKVDQQQNPASLRTRAVKILERLRKADQDLVDGEQKNTTLGINSFTESNAIEPCFGKETDQW